MSVISKKRYFLLVLLVLFVFLLQLAYAQTSGTTEVKAPDSSIVSTNTCSGDNFDCVTIYRYCAQEGQYTAHFTADSETTSTNAYFCNCISETRQCTVADYQNCTTDGQWQTLTNIVEADNCADGWDNDCDGLIDLEDGACFGSSGGVVTDAEGNRLEDVKIEFFLGATKKASGFTNSNGMYDITTRGGNLTIIASHQDYVPKTFSLEVFPNQYTWINFSYQGGNPQSNAGPLSSAYSCESDCTYAGDNQIHGDCSNKNNCTFYDSNAALICDLAQPGWIKEYNSTHDIRCPSGAPLQVQKAEAIVSCSKENIMKTTKIINYKGKLVKFVIVNCGA